MEHQEKKIEKINLNGKIIEIIKMMEKRKHYHGNVNNGIIMVMIIDKKHCDTRTTEFQFLLKIKRIQKTKRIKKKMLLMMKKNLKFKFNGTKKARNRKKCYVNLIFKKK